MKLYKKILYPTDFSENSIRTMDYAVKVSQDQNAELILLYAYRLINNGNADHISHRNTIAEHGRKSYDTVNKEVLERSEVDYTYLSEVGFIEDRILATVKENDVDLVVICDSVHKAIESQNKNGNERLLKRISCPMMLVPPDV
ncbi:MAG: universal stress protein [Bacteroidota bacterium]